MHSSNLFPVVIAALLHTATAQPLDVPFVRQQKEGCGPAVLSMLLEYWSEHGSPTPTQWTPGALYSRLYDSSIRGVTGGAMTNFLREQDYISFTFRGEWSDLAKNTSLGRPVIVALAPKKNAPNHFVLIIGTNIGGTNIGGTNIGGTNTNAEVVMHDPDRAAYVREPIDRFLKQWNETGRWTLLAVPRTRKEQSPQ